jgi:hypothetical protein
MKLILAAACALPLLAAAADDFPMPRMLKGMEKGQWRMEILENSRAKPGQKMPVMTVCSNNLMEQAKKHEAAKSERKCAHKLLKDSSDEAVMETTCPDRTTTVSMKRESSKSMLTDIQSTRDKEPMHIKMRYTYVGACREGQSTVTFDKNSEQCQKINASVAKMDPAKSCANSGANREQCEKTVRQQIAQAKAMCN